MRLISLTKKYTQEHTQFLTTLSLFENIFSVNAKKLLCASILFFVVSFANAFTRTSTANGGAWAAGSTWVGGVAPVAGDDAIIATTGANSVALGANATIVNVTINAGGVLNGNFRLTITGNFNNSGIFTYGGEVRFSGAGNQNIQGFTTTGLVGMRKTGGTATFTGNVNGARLTINGTGGTLNLGAGLSHTFTGVVNLTAGALNGGSSTINVNSVSTTAWNGNGSLFTPATSTVNFGANGNQTISASNPSFYNLTFSVSGIKSLPSSNIIHGTLSMEGLATVPVSPALTIPKYGPAARLRYNRASAVTVGQEWTSPFISAGGVAIAKGIITLNAAKVMNFSIPLSIDSGATLDTNNFGLTFGGNFANSGIFTAGSSLISITNTMATQTIAGFTTTGLVSMTKTAGTATFTSAVNGAGLTLNGVGGTLNLGVGLSHIFAGDVALTGGVLDGGSSTLNLNSATTTVWTGTGTNFNAGSGTVIFGGTGQTLATASTFNNLIFSNSGLKTLTGVPTITGILSMEGTATVSVTPVYGAAATLQYNRLVSQVTGSEWINTFVATGGVKINNTGTITMSVAKVFNAAVPLTIAAGATLDNGGFAITGGSILTVASGGALKLSGATVFPTFATATLDSGSTVEYSGLTQAVAIKNYGNLILSGSGNKTFTGATTIAGNLGINDTSVAIFPNESVSTAYTFTISGVMQATGFWGSSISSAIFKDASRFGSTTTGTLNATNSCIFGYWSGKVSNDWNVAANWCGGIPSLTSSIIIPSAPTNQPVIGAVGGLCKNITINTGATLTINGSNSLALSGNWTNNGTFTANNSTVNFSGGIAQTIGGSSVTTFNNLTNSNSANTVTAELGIIVKNILNISNDAAILEMSTNILTDGGAFTNAGSGLLRTSNISATPIPAGKIWSNSVNYNNLTGGQTIVGGNYNGSASLDLDNTSGTQTASGHITIGNQFNIDNGGTPSFNMAGFNLTTAILKINAIGAIVDMGVGNLSYSALAAMDGKIRFSGLSNGLAIPIGTVEYYGGTQTVASGIYSNLLFSGVSGNYTIASDLNTNNSFVITNGNVNVQNSVSLTLNCAVNVVAPGTLTFENNASLVQTGYTGANVGNITVKRYTTPIILDDFTYWSSPTSGTQTIYNFSPDTQGDKFFEYNNDWAGVNAAGTSFTRGIGYAIRSPESTSSETPTIDTSYKFTGVPNNGRIDIPVTVRASDGLGERLIGNPYPSAIDAEAFINANVIPSVSNPTGGTINQTITGTLYFWTHNHSLTQNNGNDYNGDDYATFNLTGGSNLLNGSGNNIEPDGFIASGQGFFVENDFAGNITFDNTMRLNTGNANFYKVKSQKELEKHRIWLNLSNNTINGSQTVVGYVENATNDYDPGYDSHVYDEKQLFSIYSLIGVDKMVIQGRALPFVDTDAVPLGYSINTVGNATISIDHVDGLFDDTQNVYLEDKVLNAVHNLKENPYNFSSEVGTFNDRFVLRYTDKNLGTNDFDLNSNTLLIAKDRNGLKIKSAIENIKRVTVFDLLGRKVFEKGAINNTEFHTSNITLYNQIGIVKVTLTDGQEISKKIIF